MDGPGQLTFTCARLAKDEDVGIGGSDLAGGFQHRHHRRTVRIKAVLGFAYFTFQGLQARGKLAYFQLLGGSQPQLVGAARLDQVIRGAGLDRVHCRIDRRVRGDDHHPHPGGLDTHLRQHVEAVVLAEAQIKEAQVEHLALQQGFGLGGAVGRGHAIALVLQAIAEGAQDRGLVIHQQNAALVVLG